MWTIEFFEKDNGRCPTQEFLDKLNAKKDIPTIINRFKQLEEHGNNLKRPLVGTLRGGIYEVRVKTINGPLRFFYFFFIKNTIVITHGVKRKEFQEADIDLAIEYRKIYYARHGMKP